MKKNIFIIALIIGLALNLYSSNNESRKERNFISAGNDEYNNENYLSAIENYKNALKVCPLSQVAEFNLASALVKQNTIKQDSTMLADAEKIFVGLKNSNSKSISQKSKFNLGNISFNKQDYKSSIDYFKSVLREDPSNEAARKNLRIAQLKLQEQQQNKNQENKEQQKEQEQNQDKQEDKKQEQKNKEQEEKQQEKQSQDKENKKDKQNQQSSSISADNAEKILKSIEEKEQQTLLRINELNKKAKERQHQAQGRVTDKPW